MKRHAAGLPFFMEGHAGEKSETLAHHPNVHSDSFDRKTFTLTVSSILLNEGYRG